MTKLNDHNDPELKKKLAAARLAMSPEEEKIAWQNREEYLHSRKKEAALSMASSEQKARLEDEAKAREELLQKQKKLEALELARKQKEIERKRQLAEEQKKRDAETEAERVRQIEQIMESRAEIKGLVKQETGGPRTIRTLKDDIAETVKRDKVTASKIIIQEKATRQAVLADKERKKKKRHSAILMATSLTLVVLGVLAVTFVWWQKKEEARQPIPVAKESLVFTDRQIKIDATNLNRTALRLAQKEEYEKWQLTDTNTGGITELYFVRTILETVGEKKVEKTEILTAYDYLNEATIVTDDFSRFTSDDFMLGFLGYDRLTPFFIFKTSNHKDLTNALLWEGKSILTELYDPYWTETKKSLSQGSLFNDITLKNYDLRILKSDGGDPLAGYAFLDEKTLLIFETEEDFLKILDVFLLARPLTR